MDNHEKQTMPFLAELGQLKAAMWGPIPIEPAHSFTYGHLRQRQMDRGRISTNDKVAQNCAHTCQLMHGPLCIAYIFAI